MTLTTWLLCLGVSLTLLLAKAAPAQGSPEADRAALDRAAKAVDSARKGDAVVTVTDADGNPVPRATVTVTQIAPDFRVGCNIFGFDRFKTPEENETYARRFAELFDFATLPFYWRSYEPERGKPDHAYRETVARWCQEHGIRTKGHPLCWTNDAGTPKWLEPLPATEKRDLLEGRVRDCVSHFAGLIDTWDVVNEPTHLPPWPTFATRADYVEAALQWAREANPDAYLIVNEYYVIQDTEGEGPFYKLVHELIKRDAPFDAIGMQCHEPRTDWYPLDMVEKTFAKYAELGKPIHVTEFTPTSGGKPITGSYHEGTWTEEAQADYAEQFFRIAFANPAVECIVWWDLAESHAWLEGGGLLRKDLAPKLVYDRIRDLVREEWRTNVQAETDADGQVTLRGFCGDCGITAQAGDKTAKAALHISRDETANVAIALTP